MRGRGWFVLGGLTVLVAIVVLLRGPAGAGDSPEHRSDSDAANGTSALRLYAEALGHPTGTVEGDFTLPPTPAILFVFSPTDNHGFSAAESQQLNNWLTAGGVLIYADEQSEPQLDPQLGLRRARVRPGASFIGTLRATAPAPILGGVTSVAGGVASEQLRPSPGQVALLRNTNGEVIAIRAAVGQGQVIALTDPLILCNGYLGLRDNGRLAADLLALAPSGGRVLFDEFHHGAVASGSPETAWMATPWGAGLLWAVIVLFAGIALRGRAFGPLLTLRPARDRSSAEYASAVGSLLHRTGARAVTLQTLLAATRRAIAERVGLAAGVPDERFQEAVARLAPGVAGELTDLETSLPRAAQSETSVMETARRLHQLAYPLASNVNGKESR